MGSEQSTQQKPGTVPVYNKVIDKTKMEIVLKKIFFTTQLQRDRKKGLIAQKEKELLQLIAQPKIQRNKDSETAKASVVVADEKNVKAQEAVMRYCDIVKDRALVIEMSKGDPSKINDLLPFIESIVWGSKNLNLDCAKDFELFLHQSFGPEVFGMLSKGANVLPELRECFDSILPTEKEIKKYLLEFCRKNSIEIELMNEIGHDISESGLLDLPTGGNNAGGYPGGNNMGGYPGGNNTGGYPSGGYPGGGYPSGGGYPNQYPQQDYQQQQQQYQPTYQQPTYQQPTYQQPTYQQPTYQQQQPTVDPRYQPQQFQPQYQQPTQTQTPTPTTTNNTTPQSKPQEPTFDSSGDSAYPTFKKML